MPPSHSTQRSPNAPVDLTDDPGQLRSQPISHGWSQQNIHWVGLAVVWWLGSLMGWWGVYMQSWLMTSSDWWSQESFSGASVSGTGLFILLISATLRLPAVTTSATTTPIQNYLVWLLSISANINWLGMLCLRVDSLWIIVPLLGIALVVETWLVSCSVGADSRMPENASKLVNSEFNSISNPEEPPFSELSDAGNPEDSDSGGRVHRTTTEQTIHGGFRQLFGDIIIDWQEGQRTQSQVVGFVPAFDGLPLIDFEADCPNTVVRCLNCTQTGMRLELKRSGSLAACQSCLSWAATEEKGAANQGSEELNHHASSNRGLA